MGALLAVAIGSSVIGGILGKDAADKNAEAAIAYAKAQAVLMRKNAQRLRESKSDVKDEADSFAHDIGMNAKQMVGKQRTSYVGQGVALDSEVAKQITNDTREISQQDIDTIRVNQWKKIEGIEFDATMLEKQANMTVKHGQAQADAYKAQGTASLVGGAAGAASAWIKG